MPSLRVYKYSLQLFTISRCLSGIIFIATAFTYKWYLFDNMLLLYAISTDPIDGYIARKYNIATNGGRFLDLFSDKYLTTLCVIYAIKCQMPVIPCCFIMFREISLMAIRFVENNIVTPQRSTGGLFCFIVWCSTLFLFNYKHHSMNGVGYLGTLYWAIGLYSVVNTIYKFHSNKKELISMFIIC